MTGAIRALVVGVGIALFAGGIGCTDARKSSRGFHLPDGDATRGREVFVAMKCTSCHTVWGDPGLPQPVAAPPVPVVIGGRVQYLPADGRIVTAIIDPSHQLGPSFKRDLTTAGGRSRMGDFSDVLSVRELIDLVAFVQSRYERSHPIEHVALDPR